MMAETMKRSLFMIVLLSVCILSLKLLNVSNYLPKLHVLLGRSDVTCERGLLQAADDMLNGEMMPLPLHNKSTRWKFKERVPVSEMFVEKRKYNILLNDTTINGTANEGYKKARKYFLVFAHNCCKQSKRRAMTFAITKGGFDNARLFNMSDLTSKFRQTHGHILKTRRGAGYWLWKPYILLKVLLEKNITYGDFVMYLDADTYTYRSAEPWLQDVYQTKMGIGTFNYGAMEGMYTKRDAMVLMDMDFPQVRKSKQLMGGFVAVRKSCDAIQFVMEWLAYLSDSRIATDQSNTMGLPNYPEFKDHRHDQSVLSLLSKKWGLPSWPIGYKPDEKFLA